VSSEVVVDTNVLAISERCHPEASDACVNSCIELARQIHDGDLVVIVDDQDQILLEYLRYVAGKQSSAVGKKIARLLRTRKNDTKVCRRLSITPQPNNAGGYVEVPASLSNFDKDDQKFLAVAKVAGGTPKIFAGLDGEWWERAADLANAGFDVQFRCSSDLIARDSAAGGTS
jgi:hypothetical protein